MIRRCDNDDFPEGVCCNTELVDGGYGVGMFCPLCRARDRISEQLAELAALQAERERLRALLGEIREADKKAIRWWQGLATIGGAPDYILVARERATRLDAALKEQT